MSRRAEGAKARRPEVEKTSGSSGIQMQALPNLDTADDTVPADVGFAEISKGMAPKNRSSKKCY